MLYGAYNISEVSSSSDSDAARYIIIRKLLGSISNIRLELESLYQSSHWTQNFPFVMLHTQAWRTLIHVLYRQYKASNDDVLESFKHSG
jgi:hypothetical protein